MSERKHTITRRDFLWFGAGAMTYVLSKEFFRWGFDAPMMPDMYPETPDVPGYSGWLERRNPDRPVFIDPEDKGHKAYLTYMATHDPSLVRTHKKAFHDLFYNEPEKKISLRESFWRHIGYAYNELKYSAAHLEDVVHLAMYSFASVNSNFYTVGDVYQNFSEWDMYHQLPDSSYIDIEKYRRNVADVLQNNNNQKADEIMHFAGFAFLTYQSWYAQTHGLPDADRIPRFASQIRSLDSNPYSNSQMFAGLGEVVWEFDETHDLIREMWSAKKWLPQRKGLFEVPGVFDDALTSYSGIRFASFLTKESLTIDDLESACALLDTPEALLPTLKISVPAYPVSFPVMVPVQ